jgi:NitT/TauT family transport system substrate-binding protein
MFHIESRRALMPGGCVKALAVALLLATALAPLARAQTTVALGYGITSDYLPAFVAKDDGFFEKHGLDVTMIALASSSLAPPALVGGSLTIAQTTPSVVMLANEGGLDLLAVAGVARLKRGNQRTSLITRPGLTVTKAADLKGRTVGVPGLNAAMDLVLRKWLLDGGVEIVETPFAQMGDRLKTGQLDAAFLIEPLLSRVVATGEAEKSVDVMSAENPDILGACYAATRAWAEAHREAVLAYQAALGDAIAFIKANPAATKAAEMHYLKTANDDLPDMSVAETAQDMQFWADLLLKVGAVKRPIDPASVLFR